MTTTSAPASTGAAPAADVSTASSAPNTGRSAGSSPRASFEQRMQSRASELMQSKAPSPAAAVEGEPLEQRAEGEQAQDGQQEPSDLGADKAEKPRSIPEAAFKQRLAEEARKRETLRKEKASVEFELRKAQEAIKLLQRTLDEQSQARAEGKPYDPKDDEVMQLRLQDEARKLHEQMAREHEEALRQMQQEMLAEARAEQLRADYSRQIDEALEAFPLVSRRDLIAEMKAEAQKARPAPTKQLAQRLHDKALEVARRLGMQAVPSQGPASPSTARPVGQRSPTKLPNNVQGYESFIRSMRGEAG